MPSSPESPIREFNPLGPSVVMPVQLVSANNTASKVFDSINNSNDKMVRKIQIQNTGTTAIKYMLNETAAASVYHGILNGGTGAADGLGGILSLNLDRGIKTISLFSAGAYTAVILKM